MLKCYINILILMNKIYITHHTYCAVCVCARARACVCVCVYSISQCWRCSQTGRASLQWVVQRRGSTPSTKALRIWLIFSSSRMWLLASSILIWHGIPHVCACKSVCVGGCRALEFYGLHGMYVRVNVRVCVCVVSVLSILVTLLYGCINWLISGDLGSKTLLLWRRDWWLRGVRWDQVEILKTVREQSEIRQKFSKPLGR